MKSRGGQISSMVTHEIWEPWRQNPLRTVEAAINVDERNVCLGTWRSNDEYLMYSVIRAGLAGVGFCRVGWVIVGVKQVITY